MNAQSLGYRFVLTCRTLLIGLVILWSGQAPQSSASVDPGAVGLISSPDHHQPNPYHTLTMECPYPDGAATNLVLASYRTGVPQNPLNSLKNCLEPRPTRWTAVI